MGRPQKRSIFTSSLHAADVAKLQNLERDVLTKPRASTSISTGCRFSCGSFLQSHRHKMQRHGTVDIMRFSTIALNFKLEGLVGESWNFKPKLCLSQPFHANSPNVSFPRWGATLNLVFNFRKSEVRNDASKLCCRFFLALQLQRRREPSVC